MEVDPSILLLNKARRHGNTSDVWLDCTLRNNGRNSLAPHAYRPNCTDWHNGKYRLGFFKASGNGTRL